MKISTNWKKAPIGYFLALCLFLTGGLSTTQAQSFEAFTFTDSPAVSGEKHMKPLSYKTLSIDLNALTAQLENAPLLQRGNFSVSDGIEIQLPYPDGTMKSYYVLNSPIMESGLAARYPGIQTYVVYGIDDALARGRISVTPMGFHAMITGRSGTIYIDPYNRETVDHGLVYRRSDLVRTYQDMIGMEQHEPVVENMADLVAQEEAAHNMTPMINGETFREYRIAVAASAQYTIFHGGSVEDAMAAIVVTLNRVNSIYERDLAVQVTLIDDNEDIIYTDPNNQPYTNGVGVGQLNANQTNIDNVIGSANYDIGHLFVTGGGGVAQLNSVCNNSGKARGMTGLPQPVGDPFDVDYVSHEIGHQFGATHTFNGSTGGCSGNRTAVSAYEPGSGSTIMAYSGLCPGQNIQNFSEEFFHIGSISQMVSFINGPGNSCAETSDTNNSPPEVDAGEGGFVIPISTPFRLEGSATDPDGDELTYSWEQYDRGPQGPPNNPEGNAPLFRVFPQQDEPVRIFPRIQDVLSGNQTLGELLPDYSRTLTFRLAARDNNPDGGGISFDQIQFTSTADAGPFLVPAPGTGTEWQSGGQALVVWDVAGTNLEPINVETVNIRLSTDGGDSFDTVLAEEVPNNGFAWVDVPSGTTSQARVWVEANGNVFFNVNPNNFEISNSPATPNVTVSTEEIEIEVADDDVANESFTIGNDGQSSLSYFVEVSTDDLPSNLTPLPFENIDITNQAELIQSGQNREVTVTVDGNGLDGELYGVNLVVQSNDPDEPQKTVLVTVDVRSEVQFQRVVNAPEGWRLISTPISEAELSEVFNNLITQGFPGSDDPDAENSSIYRWGSSGLTAVPDIDYIIEGGSSVLAYIFDDGFPKFMRATGFANRTPFEKSLTNQLVFPGPGVDGPSQRGWNLIGNPYNSSIDLRNLTDDDFNNVNRSIYVLKPTFNDGKGGYLPWNGFDIYPSEVDFNGQIDPFQGFWVQATGSNAFINLNEDNLLLADERPDADRAADNTELHGDHLNMPHKIYTLELTAGDITTYATIFMSDEGQEGTDRFDAWQMMSPNSDYVYMYMADEDRPLAINSIPLNSTSASLEFPMKVESSFNGEFTVRLAKVGGNVTNFIDMEVTDNETGSSATLLEGDTFTFDFENGSGGGTNPMPLTNLPAISVTEDPARLTVTLNLNPTTNVEDDDSGLPNRVELAQNYPNPFNPTTVIEFGLPDASDVRLDVYNVMGQRVATLVNGRMNAGYHSQTFDASRLASGVYIYRLEAGGQVLTGKMTLVK